MGNSISSGVAQILGHPLQFLSGRSCDSKCGATWDVMSYIQNLCVAHLLKFVMVAALFYFVLLFLYLLFSLSNTFSDSKGLFFDLLVSITLLLYLHMSQTSICKEKRRRDVEEFDALSPSNSEEDEYELEEICVSQKSTSGTSQFSVRRKYKNEHLRRSLRPNTHEAHVELSGSCIHHHKKKVLKNIDDHSSPTHHHLRVARSSNFSRKGSRFRRGNQRRRR